MLAAEIIFWFALALVVHSYILYPFLLKVLSSGRKNNMLQYEDPADVPFVSVIIAAHNEEAHIGKKIDSIYSGDFPADGFEVLVGSDASDDRTVEIVAGLAARHPSLKLMNFSERRGKGSVVNDLVRSARGEILVLTDANVFFDRGTIYNLVKHFRNPKVGLVDTNMINRGMTDDGISFQEKAYISREVRIKNREGRLMGAMMGPFGGCYAIRKDDYEKVPGNFLVDDFYINMKIFEKGKIAINDLEARVFEEVPDKLRIEFNRKVRIGTGNFQNLRAFWKLIFTNRYGFAFFSHKVIRWFGPLFLLVALAMNIILAVRGGMYLYILAFHLLFYLIPMLDQLFRLAGVHIRPFRLVTHFISMNAALFVGFFRSFMPVRTGVWERTNRT